MIEEDDLVGSLLVAVPNTIHGVFQRGILLVVSNWIGGSNSLIINKPIRNGMTVGHIMANFGIQVQNNEPIYYGGPDETNKLQVVHSLDWCCTSTKKLSDSIGITGEIYILSAIARGDGPDFYRCIAGHRFSKQGELESELNPLADTQSWLTLPATIETVFKGVEDDQWMAAITEAGRLQVANWF